MFYLTETQNFNKRNILVLIITTSLVLFSFLYFYVFAYNPGSDIQVCTSSVSQPACYSSAYPTPTLNWTISGGSSQSSYQIQIDQNSSFSDPEIDTGEVSSGSSSYQVAQAGLSFGTTYYWRVKVKDNYNSWTDWAVADSSFTTVEACNVDPTATNLSVSSGNSSTYCGVTAAHYFSWIYSDADNDDQSRFQFQVDNNSDFSSLEVDGDYTGLSNPSPTTNNQVVTVVVSPSSGQIAYNTTYYWRVKVYDILGKDSGWVEGTSFTTDAHLYPNIDFVWVPNNPSVEEDVVFVDQSTIYGGATKSSWSWIFENGDPSSSTDQTPIIQFTSTGAKQVSLEVTDSDSFSCSLVRTINSQTKLPEYKEVLPE